MERLEEIKKPKIEKPEEALSLAELVEQGEGEIAKAEKKARKIRKASRDRIQRVAESVGVSEEVVEEEKKKMVFEKREGGIFMKLKTLVEGAKEKIKLAIGKEVELGEEDIEVIEEEYEPFDPVAEYLDVKKFVEGDASPDEKKEKLDEFKKEKMKQKEGMGKLQLDLREKIEENPDAPVEKLMGMVIEKASKLRLTEEQKDFYKELLESYHQKHEAVVEAREKNPKDKELFKSVFGLEPKGKVKVVQGPMSFYFKCSNPDDFVEASILAEEAREDHEVSQQEKEVIRDTQRGIMLFGFSKIPELKNLLILENSKLIKNLVGSERVSEEARKHEEQHVLFRHFEESVAKENTDKALKVAKNKEEKMDAVLSYLRILNRSRIVDNPAKDEILAFYKQGKKASAIYKLLIATEEEGGSYDFFTRNKDKVLRKIIKDFGISIQTANEAVEQVFSEEYHETIVRALESLKELETMGKTRDEIVEFFIGEPVYAWPNLVRRLKQVKKGR